MQRQVARPLVVVTALAALAILLGALPASAVAAVPADYLLVARHELAPGVEHLRLARADPPLVVNVAHLAAGAPVSLRAVLSNEAVAGEAPLLERTSSMCARVHCVMALNGDFAVVGSDQPVGGLVTGGRLLRSPAPTHHQLSVTKEGRLLAGSFEWSGTLVPTDLRSLALKGVNVNPAVDQVVLYTPGFGPTTPTGPGGPGVSPGGPADPALVLRTVEPAGPLRLSQTSLVELSAFHENGSELPIPTDGAVLSGQGQGAEELRQLWARVHMGRASTRALLRLETPDGVVESVGGSPILLRNAKRWFADVDDNFTRGRHPRTLVGWNSTGETFLVAVDGRQPGVSVGMTLAEAADLLLALGATDGINLDGGGSTTFVANGTVANEPSDIAVRRGGKEIIRHTPQPGDRVIGRVERPVASAIAVVESNEVVAPNADPLARPSLGLAQALALPAGSSTDPGSVPGGGLPALLSEESEVEPRLDGTAAWGAVAANAFVALALGTFMATRRRRKRGGRKVSGHEPVTSTGWRPESLEATEPRILR